MKIGIIGAGDIGRVYSTLWHKAGHEIFLSSRNPEDHRGFVAQLGDRAYVGTAAEAAAFGDVVLLAVNYPTVDSAIQDIAPHTVGKPVIDATNPLGYDADGKLETLIDKGQIAAEVMAAKLPDARLVKALTTLWSGHVETKQDAANSKVAMPFAADDLDAQTLTASLIKDAGFDPVFIGSLAASGPLDPGSSIWNVVLTKQEVLERVASFRSSSGGVAAGGSSPALASA